MRATIWPIKQHTHAKHELLRKYLAAWFPILAQGGHRRIIFLDGFAGPGVYAGGELGSPLIALKTLIEHHSFCDLLETEFVFIFIEARQDRFTNLKDELNEFWSQYESGKPENIRVCLFNKEFVNVAEQIINHICLDNKQLAPTFAFVDPFGWSGVPMSVIRRLLASDKCEVLFSFMFDSIRRFISDEGLVEQFIELFGTDKKVLSCIADLSGDKRNQYIHDLYINQLRSQGGFRFVRSFELVDANRGRTEYFLMFGTRSVRGLDKMKDVMWTLDPVAGARFAGFTGGQRILFDLKPDMGPLRQALLERFHGEIVTIEDIEFFVITETDYRKSHYKGQLKYLENEDLIHCESVRKKRGTYPPNTRLHFIKDRNQNKLF